MTWWTRIFALLLVSGALGVPADEDYFYDEEVEEELSTHVPKFSSKPQTVTVKEGATVTLPCFMDKATGVIIWQRGSDNIFTGSFPGGRGDARFKLMSSGQKGNSLEIKGVTAADSGSYVCTVSSNPPVSLNHTVDVQYPPQVTTNPENGVLIIKQGSPASLVCSAKGNPTPTVTWTKKGGLLPYGEKKLQSQALEIGAVERTHMGNYACTVDNTIEQPIVKNFRLEVNYAPEIEVMENVVHTGAGVMAKLVCRVHGQPMPQVSWARTGGPALDPAHHKESNDGDMYSITIDQVVDSDMGVYTCRAKSALGTAAAPIEVTGKPKPVMVSSNPNGEETDSYSMQWEVESFAPIEEYKVIHKMIEHDGEAMSAPQQWEEEVFAPTNVNDGNGHVYKQSHSLRDLKAAAVYEAIVTARNKYGWSVEPSEAFTLSTRGAKALGSKDPNSSTQGLRSALAACVAALFALVLSL